MPTLYKILLLDKTSDWLTRPLDKLDVEYDLRTPSLSGPDNYDYYCELSAKSPLESLSAIRMIQAIINEINHVQFDLVVIGNNLGAGLDKAQAIATKQPELIPKTLIVWNNHTVQDEKPYRQLGYSYFGNRYQAIDDLLRLMLNR